MDTKTLFQQISRKIFIDFEASRQVWHRGSRGTIRENNLKAFLSEERLPARYGIGSGEIVGHVRDVSNQSDIIIYDKLNGVTLIYDETTKVFPIDSVYGIIEVKSTLSKSELIDCLDKIKNFKQMAPTGVVTHQIGPLSATHARSQPFGMVFAYSLYNNSLSSLLENLREWESANPASVWPNYICILGSGVIYHYEKVFEPCISSSKINEKSSPQSFSHGDDSLFQFYCALHDACAEMQLGAVELRKYYDPAIRIGKYVVYGRGAEASIIRDGQSVWSHISEQALDRVIEWCSGCGPMKYDAVLIKRFGTIASGMEGLPMLGRDVFLYNPDGLPGLHELGENPIINREGGPMYSRPCLAAAMELFINNLLYVIPFDSLLPEDYVDWGE